MRTCTVGVRVMLLPGPKYPRQAQPIFHGDLVFAMEGLESIRGTVKDYRVSGALGDDFPLLHV